MSEKAKRGQHMSIIDLADILKIITVAPMTARQVSEQHKCNLIALRRILRSMVQMGIAHVCGWDCTTGGTPAAVFSGGEGENVPAPETRDGRKSLSPWARGYLMRPLSNQILFAALVKALDEGATIAELVERTGCNEATATRFANHMRRLGLAHIGAWVQSWTGYPARVFMLGQGRDARRPKALDEREKSLRQYHARKAKEKHQAINSALFLRPVAEAA